MSRPTSPRLRELPYQPDSAPLFESIVDYPWAVFLDSGPSERRQGRYDILAADPWITLINQGARTWVCTRDRIRSSWAGPFTLIRHYLEPGSGVTWDLPFAGGVLGYFGYDLARRLEHLPSWAIDEDRLPEMAVGIYDWAVVVDHITERSWLVAQGRDQKTLTYWDDLYTLLTYCCAPLDRGSVRVCSDVVPNLDRRGYARAFRQIKRYILMGDCYQVNFAQRFTAGLEGDPWLLYRGLRQLNPAPFGVYLKTPHAQILSSSPERFLKLRNDEVVTQPIKGTRPRGADPKEDRASAEELRMSPKDRAENLMIVDLLRNDLGKVCTPGSVYVPTLFSLESFATVHHLISTVVGQLELGYDGLDLLQACFPGGSITGAPKLRAMEIIEELEWHRRGVYCGAIGYIGYDGAMDTNLAIRTLTYSDGLLRFWAGGGIVADSELEEEYQESLNKIAAMLELLHNVGRRFAQY